MNVIVNKLHIKSHKTYTTDGIISFIMANTAPLHNYLDTWTPINIYLRYRHIYVVLGVYLQEPEIVELATETEIYL